MNFSIYTTQPFDKKLKLLAKKFPSLKIEFAQLIALITSKPETGIPLGSNCFKIRMSIKSKGKGKSGGARVITFVYLQNKSVYLLTMYDKGEKTDLLPGELEEMIKSLELT